ncbi:kinase-like protein [Rhizopus microsporus var. microsporus]|uniref:Kinase-like protein n=2 Tax=Rhizopus microsporus TaxID=58291 RepID=A0A2G4T815_RHIZD|nr:kinase-like protein [Rhizopus microsporus ATCC 52813]ORE09257.1 kinase-like protein [Rhizopus microsporus var. microsporus]PHZ17164.1 kinase-like protein [Rhizopus microsporus ATCC 52813]
MSQPTATSLALQEERKRELSPTPTTETSKRARHKLKSILSDSSDDHAPLISLEAYNNIDDDEEDEEYIDDHAYSISGRPARRSLLSDLLSSLHQDDSFTKRRRSLNSSALGILSNNAHDDDDEDEKTTLPITRSSIRPPADEVDAFFTSSNTDYGRMRQQHHYAQTDTPAFITHRPHFITLTFFQEFGPHSRAIPLDSPKEEDPLHITYFDREYSKGHKLGSGEHSEVYYTRRLSTGDVSAIKKSKSPFTGWEDRWLQLIEVENLYKVRFSERCLGIKSAWEENGHLYIETELCACGTLQDYFDFKDRKIPEDTIWGIFYEILIGINDIHEANVAHLDLKPSNILIDNSGSIKIADFGISIQTPAEMRWVKGEGDRKYMAPELLREDFDKPADIYSLGMLLLELATGLGLPEKGEPWELIRFGDLTHQEEELSKLTPELSNMIRCLLNRDPIIRPTAKELLASPEFVKIRKSTEGPLLSYVQELEKLEAEAPKTHEHQDIFSTPESRIMENPYPSPL